GRIHPRVQVPEQALPQAPRGDRHARKLHPQHRQAEAPQAAVDAPGLAELLQPDRGGSPHAGVGRLSGSGHSSATTLDATRSELAMIVSPGPTPSDVGRELPSTAKMSGFANIRQSGSRTAWAGSLPNRRVPHWWATCSCDLYRAAMQYTAPD